MSLVAALMPGPVAAHAIGGTFELPVPLWLYLAGAGSAVAASFAVLALATRGTPSSVATRTLEFPDSVSAPSRLLLRVVGLAWWYGAVVVGIVVGDISPLPAVLLWIGIWVGLPILAVLVGNPWPSLSPFRTTFGAMEWVAGRIGLRRLDLGLRFPTGFARWPAVILLALAVWAELILPGSEVAGTVGLLMVAYTLVTISGMLTFGEVAWLRHAELFEVLLGWFGRIGPVGRQASDPTLCEGCDDGCNAADCVDCAECGAAANDGGRRLVLRPWASGLKDVGRLGISDATFIVLALAGVTYDGLRETTVGGGLFSAIYPPVAAVLGSTSTATFLVAETAQLMLVAAALLGAFTAVVALGRLLTGQPADMNLGADMGRYSVTLLPIAGGYLIAHYLTLVIQGVVWLPSLLVDPLMSLAPQLDAIPVALVWYVSVGAIVIGHVTGIVLAHRLARQDQPERAGLVGLPMVALMVGYTVLSLWIIAAP
ncbi:MAG: hypothetical protein ABIO99_07455, partial [Candidatus Limnocylindria bacterium]